MDSFEKIKEWELGVQIKIPKFTVNYVDRRGNVFDNECDAAESDRYFAREDYYNYMMSKRNWFQKLFNIKPNMSFYDKLGL